MITACIQASMTLASTAKVSPLTRPASMHAAQHGLEYLAKEIAVAEPAVATMKKLSDQEPCHQDQRRQNQR